MKIIFFIIFLIVLLSKSKELTLNPPPNKIIFNNKVFESSSQSIWNGNSYKFIERKFFNPLTQKNIKLKTVTISMYYENSKYDKCSLLYMRIDSKRAPKKKLIKGILRIFKLKNSNECGNFYDGEKRMFGMELKKNKKKIPKLKRDDVVVFYLCNNNIVVYKKSNVKYEWNELMTIVINKRILCQIKKNFLNI